MRNQPLRVIQYGCGLMGVVIIRYLVEKGFEIVGAIDNNPDIIGQDIGQLAGLGRSLGVQVEADADAVLDRGADIAILTLTSLMGDMEPFFAACAKRGVNAISTCEEAFFPRTTSPEVTARLDALAKQNGCTLTGSGYQDVFWGNLATVAAGAVQRLTSLKGASSYNVDDYGIALATVHGVGLTPEEFDEKIAQANVPSYAMNVPGWLAGQLGLTMTGIAQVLLPEFATAPLESTTLGRVIEVGQAIGMTARATAQTAEGVEIVMNVTGKVYRPGQVDQNEWTLSGEPQTLIRVVEPKTVELTCATIVNRLPQVAAAPSGFVTLESLPPARYLPIVA
ncbi:MAG: hypothetical protein LBI84_08985 [Propionibacteriaceae bacterium]|jgi:4-hydroxy-tetrahydrodipicolinate reductase|nr:hypothetical protein [Propionibacteriaceae bacterium]